MRLLLRINSINSQNAVYLSPSRNPRLEGDGGEGIAHSGLNGMRLAEILKRQCPSTRSM
jgi:hypothetical protein